MPLLIPGLDVTLSCQTPPTTHRNLLLTRSPSPLNPQPPKSLHLEKCVAAVHRRSFGSPGSADPPRNSLEVAAESCRRESEETTGRKSNQPGHNASSSSEVSFIGIVDHWSYQRKQLKTTAMTQTAAQVIIPILFDVSHIFT